ncbi:hypothetical protein QZH56_35465 [Streptomyces olivoreticuli]|uniref:hypothetical protein n=1 Tax=Streptomyces olivoreticuli TaxID=68246 RepID=UPI002659308C|nr:hypothetical protein [Streptomyces olivoreticuli]WKK23928.1 hypothetical protein QZH56_35465 [Streptomyces olivoreticuli]
MATEELKGGGETIVPLSALDRMGLGALAAGFRRDSTWGDAELMLAEQARTDGHSLPLRERQLHLPTAAQLPRLSALPRRRHPSKTSLCPQDLVHDADALFYVGLALTDAWHHVGNADDGSDEFTWWIFADDKSSWATVEYVPGQEVCEVDQYGPRNLWDETHAAYRLWEGLGKPGRDRAGLTVNRQGQRIWLDSPGNIIH